MNKQRREAIAKLAGELYDIRNQLDDLRQDEQDAIDNLEQFE